MHALLELTKDDSIKRFIKKRTVLLYQGEIPRSAFILKKGIIKVYSINASGDEQIAAFHVTGDILPDTWVFGKATSALYYYEAVTDCELFALSRDSLRDIIQSSPELLAKVFDHIVTNYTGALMRITALEQSRAREKILHTLYYLMFRHGVEHKPGVFTVRLGLTHATIAEMVGLTRETIASELSKLKKRTVLTYNTREYIINKEKLERLLGEDRFDSLVRE